MYFLYSIALTLLFLALLPYFLYQAARHGKYFGSFWQRLGWLPSEAASDGRPTIWLHAVSVGEFNAARPLISALKREMSDYRLVVSTTTLSGQKLALTTLPSEFDAAFYFPFDWSFAARKALRRVKPELVILMETELWPNFLRQCRKNNVSTVLANARLSSRSVRGYSLVRGFIFRAVGDISLFIAQSEGDAERARLLGTKPSSIRVCGNTKYDLPIASADSTNLFDDAALWLGRGGISNLIVAGSTAAGEENVLLEALRLVRQKPGLQCTRLAIAPRRPERFDEVARLVSEFGFKLARRSHSQHTSDAAQRKDDKSAEADVLLLDSIGELATAYKAASVVFVGGSLVPRGGHNIIEPAYHSKPIIVGAHTHNFRQIVTDFTSGDALVQVSTNNPQELADQFARLLSDSVHASALGNRARAILDKNRGATECTVAAISQLLREVRTDNRRSDDR